MHNGHYGVHTLLFNRLFCVFESICKSTNVVWILFQSCQPDRIKPIIILIIFTPENSGDHRSDIRTIFEEKSW